MENKVTAKEFTENFIEEFGKEFIIEELSNHTNARLIDKYKDYASKFGRSSATLIPKLRKILNVPVNKNLNEKDVWRKNHRAELLQICAELLEYSDMDEAIQDGAVPNEFNQVNKEANIILYNRYLNEFWPISAPGAFERYIIEKFGSKSAYMNSEKVCNHRYRKIKQGMLDKYGVENAGQLLLHIEKLSKSGGDNTNPFSSEKFRYSEYIKGLACLPEDSPKFKEYRKKVDKITNKNMALIPNPDICYYTGEILNRDKSQYNAWNYATIDHKNSVLNCFLAGISAEECAAIDNLCWCTRYFNNIKREMSETQVRLSGMIERYKDVKERLIKINENN